MLLLFFVIVIIVEEGCYIILMPLLDLEFIRFNLTTSQQKRKRDLHKRIQKFKILWAINQNIFLSQQNACLLECLEKIPAMI